MGPRCKILLSWSISKRNIDARSLNFFRERGGGEGDDGERIEEVGKRCGERGGGGGAHIALSVPGESQRLVKLWTATQLCWLRIDREWNSALFITLSAGETSAHRKPCAAATRQDGRRITESDYSFYSRLVWHQKRFLCRLNVYNQVFTVGDKGHDAAAGRWEKHWKSDERN